MTRTLAPSQAAAYTLVMVNHFATQDINESARRSATPADADRMRDRALRAGRWFGWYMVLIGVVSAVYLTVIETVFVDGFERALAGSVWALIVILASAWAQRQAVQPRGGLRLLVIAAAIWLGAYLFLIGPFVRGVYGEALVPWIIGSAVLSLPFFVGAAMILLRR